MEDFNVRMEEPVHSRAARIIDIFCLSHAPRGCAGI